MYPETFRSGYGMPTRAAVAFSLQTLSLFLPVALSIIVETWGRFLIDRELAEQSGVPRRLTDLSAEALSAAGYASFGWAAALAALIAIVVKRRTSGVWGRLSSWGAGPGVVMLWISAAVIAGRVVHGRNAGLLGLLAAVGVVLVCAGMRWLAVRAVTRPITQELVESGWEIPFRARRQSVRLRVLDDRIVLDRLKSRRRSSYDNGKTVFRFDDLRTVDLVEFRHDTSFVAFPDSHPESLAETLLPIGSALLLFGSTKKWVIPIDADDGRVAIALIERRRAASALAPRS